LSKCAGFQNPHGVTVSPTGQQVYVTVARNGVVVLSAATRFGVGADRDRHDQLREQALRPPEEADRRTGRTRTQGSVLASAPAFTMPVAH
jgi:DNA-binding beta-propeller fold protein YncE